MLLSEFVTFPARVDETTLFKTLSIAEVNPDRRT
jgi:hypothetical protein